MLHNRKLLDLAAERGIVVTSPPTVGIITRYPTTDHQTRRDGAVLIRADGSGWIMRHGLDPAPVPFGVLSPLNSEDRTVIERARAKRDADRVRDALDASRRAEAIWVSVSGADPDHPYLLAKQVRGLGIRQQGRDLIVPVRATTGRMMTVQRIAPDGSKRFLLGGTKRGGYHAMGATPRDVLLICEGYATGASLYMATNQPVAVALDCSNLEPVARALRLKFPNVQLILCADDDSSTPGNPGVTRATNAARAVGGRILKPAGMPGKADFNDLHVAVGLNAVRSQIMGELT